MTGRHTCEIRVGEIGGRRGQEKREKKKRGKGDGWVLHAYRHATGSLRTHGNPITKLNLEARVFLTLHGHCYLKSIARFPPVIFSSPSTGQLLSTCSTLLPHTRQRQR